MFVVSDFLTPATLWLYDGATGRTETIKAAPPRFDASRLTVEQFEATSRDGTRIPYFVVHRRDMPLDGSTPTLLYGYGGFQSTSEVPYYSSVLGRLWLEQGNAYVVANLRGGGEFGPDWHETAMGAHKQRTWDDYIAVAEDLIHRRITSRAPSRRYRRQPGRLACRHSDHAAAGALPRRRHRSAAVRHAALSSDWRGRVMDRRVRRSAHTGTARLD